MVWMFVLLQNSHVEILTLKSDGIIRPLGGTSVIRVESTRMELVFLLKRPHRAPPAPSTKWGHRQRAGSPENNQAGALILVFSLQNR